MKKIISVLGIIVLGYVAYMIYGIVKYSHSSNWETYKEYMWIFKDSAKNDINRNFSYSYVKNTDVYNNFHYKTIYNIIVWEFKNENIVEFKNPIYIKNVNLNNVKFGDGEILNKKSDLEVNIKYGFTFNNNINVNLDNYSKVERNIEGANYKGFYGAINKMSLSDGNGEHQILFDYTKGSTPTLFLFYKKHQSLYLIMINSDEPFDENIIKILNLSETTM